MKQKAWLSWSFVKEGFLNLFWNFHKLVIYGLLVAVCMAGIITIGPALMALASSTRMVAEDEKSTVRFFAAEFRRLFLPGLFLSVLIIIMSASFWSSLYVLSLNRTGLERSIAYAAISLLTVFAFFFFYYPFAGFNESKIRSIMLKSCAYAMGHLWDTIVQISIMVILWKMLSFSPVILAILYLPLSFYFINRFIIANNMEIDSKNKTSADKGC
ncbi:MAG TPA: DUF624 domain-containing protein [Clostridiales bacterium]|nr:DUF624 domain-containing protein [Clostridiales bacterium]